jgi:alanyl-tRNA synthetase
MQADLLREKFLDFFKAKKHKIAEPDSLVPAGDPTVLFTPAGMNQFKKEFLGFDSGFNRAATCQRCLRTDDLDKVGKTPGHHTFFEMLGNFSFGDYFKKEAITFAWEFLTDELKIKKEKLWVSVYKDDDEAYKVWKYLIGVAENKIIKLTDKENFWPSEAKQKGPNGPCGPCSEIFFDRGNNVGCKRPDCTPACNCGRFVEVWNLVFTQYNRKEGGVLEPLPKKNIDTGMGLERLAAVMQGVRNNFETDLFQPIIKEIVQGLSLTTEGSPERSRRKGTVPERELIYAIADHIRAITFAIYDGVLPSNEARGYVVRKLIRKSVLCLSDLGIKQPFLYKLVPILSQVMQIPYPELGKRRENISEIILAEEKNFIAILDSSKELLNKGLSELVKKTKDKTFSEGDVKKASIIAFELYDTYGIPWGLTKDWADVHGIHIDKEIFDNELEKQKNRSKAGSAMKGDVFGVKDLALGLKETKFLGYKDYITRARILKILKDNIETKKAAKGEQVSIILDKTPFYPESGGQIGDTGEIRKGKNIFEVSDTKKIGKVIVHIGKVKEGSFKLQDSVGAEVDLGRRLSIARNHTATHLLQAALRKVLGAHVKQQGSLVAEDRLRFDFTHFKDIDKGQLDRIEEIVNSYVINNYCLWTKQMPLAEARKSGALAFFAEKYEGKVRVVSIPDISKELCGGTHLDSTGQIGLFKITQEGSVASGIRRIEAVTGTFAYKIIKNQEDVLSEVGSLLNVPQEIIAQEIQKRTKQIKELEKRLSSQKIDALRGSLDKLVQDAKIVKDIKVITKLIEDADMDLLRKNVDLIKGKTDKAVIALGAKQEDRALLVVGITPDLCQKGFDAVKLIRDIAKIIGGSGGGRCDFAQAGGNNPENFETAFKTLRNLISEQIK